SERSGANNGKLHSRLNAARARAAAPRASRGAAGSGQSLLEEVEHAAPGTLRMGLVVDRGIGRAPAVHRAFVDFDLRVQAGLVEGLAQCVLGLGIALVVVVGNG